MNIVLFASVVFAISASSAWDTKTFLLSAATKAQSQNLDHNKDLTEANEITSQLVKLSKEGRYKEALPLAQKVVEIRQQLLSPDDTSLGSAFANLGELYFANKKTARLRRLCNGPLPFTNSTLNGPVSRSAKYCS